MSDLDLSTLKAKAQRVVERGPWDCGLVDGDPYVSGNGGFVADCRGLHGHERAMFIAACSPDVVLALVEEVEALRDGCNGMQDALLMIAAKAMVGTNTPATMRAALHEIAKQAGEAAEPKLKRLTEER